MSISVYKLPSGKWRADVNVNEERATKSERLKSVATQWAKDKELELVRTSMTKAAMHPRRLLENVTLDMALKIYSETESINKKGYVSEQTRINMLRRELTKTDWPVAKIDEDPLKVFRDKLKLRGRKAGTILRYFNVLSSFFEWCRVEKKWIDHNPVRNVKLPSKPAHRDRRITTEEVQAILEAANLEFGAIPKTKTQEVGLAWLIGISTGMRAGEILNCRRSDVQLMRRAVFIADSKNGTSRTVPLDKVGAMIWALALQMHPEDEYVFSVNPASRSSLFYKLKKEAGLVHADLTFHDSRHEAASQLSKRMSAMPLAKIFGWKNLQYAMVYYNPTHEELLQQIDAGDINHGSIEAFTGSNKGNPSNLLAHAG